MTTAYFLWIPIACCKYTHYATLCKIVFTAFLDYSFDRDRVGVWSLHVNHTPAQSIYATSLRQS